MVDARLVRAYRLVGYLGYLLIPAALGIGIAASLLLRPWGTGPAAIGAFGGFAFGFLAFDALMTRVIIPRVYAACMGAPKPGVASRPADEVAG